MELHVQWKNASNTDARRHKVESDYEEFLINHFGSASSAFNCKHNFEMQHQPAGPPWNIGIVKAEGFATRDLLPSERVGVNRAKFALTFTDD